MGGHGGGEFGGGEWHGGDGRGFHNGGWGWHHGHDHDHDGFFFWGGGPFWWGDPYWWWWPASYGYDDYDYYGYPPAYYYDYGPAYPYNYPLSAYPEYDGRDYLKLGHDSGTALRLGTVTHEWLVEYLRAYIANAPLSIRDDFRRGFIAGYGHGGHSVLKRALKEARRPAPPAPPPQQAPTQQTTLPSAQSSASPKQP
jgi:hypothetical protein